MGFHIDLTKTTLAKFKTNLKQKYLPPSRMFLRDNIDKNFKVFAGFGIKNVADLLASIKTKKKVENFAKESKIDLEYLKVLAREINSTIQKPCRIKDFPDITPEHVETLAKIGIKNAKDFFEQATTQKDRRQLAKNLGINIKEISRIACLCDLSRVRYVNHGFAYFLYETGYKTMANVAKADPEKLYEDLKSVNEKRKFYRENVGKNDVNLCVKFANDLDVELEM